MLPEIGGDAGTCDASQARADFLQGGHKGKGKQHRPQHARAKLRADLGVGRYAARVVVSGAGNQTRPQAEQEISATRRRGTDLG
jgi:hypothetical protein